MFFWERLAEFAAAPALVEADGGVVSYADLGRAAEAFAETLGPQRRLVFLEMPNRKEALAAYLGCLLKGHAVHPYSDADREKLRKLIDIYRPNVIVDFSNGGIQQHWQHREAVELHSDLRLLLSTSGSTGSAKLVKLSGVNLQSNADAIARYLELDPSERAITLLKPHYSYGLSVINSHLSCGASLLLTDRSVTEAPFWEAFRTGATSFAGVPYTFETLARMNFRFKDFPSFRYATQAGGRLAPELVRDFARQARACGGRFYVMYGQTEASPRMAYLPPDKAEEHPECIGVAIPGGTLTLVDEAGATIEEFDRSGQIAYRGPNVMMGYAQTAADLASDATPGFLLTGDIACRSRDGLFYIVGRAARFVKLFGNRINLDDIEADLREKRLEAVCAGNDTGIVIAHRGPIAANVVEPLAVKYGLPAFAIETVACDEIPVLSNGKPDYQKILSFQAARRQSISAPRASFDPAQFFAIVLSRRYLRAVFTEAATILGLGGRGWSSVEEIYACILGRSRIAAQDSFTSLGGDSLNYVQVSLALEEYLGRLPAGWEHAAVIDLEESALRESVI